MNKQSGNVLFLILIAVALFAALSYAVTSSSRSSGGNASDEKMSTAFSEIQSAIAANRAALTRMTISAGVESGQLDFDTPPFTNANGYQNPTCPSDTCRIYHPQGGAMTIFTLTNKAALKTGTTSSVSTIQLIPFNRQGTNLWDVVLFMPSMSQTFCEYYNKRMGLASGTSASANQSSLALFPRMDSGSSVAVVNADNLTGTIGDTTDAEFLRNTDTGCYYQANSGNTGGVGYAIIAVIKAR